MKRHVFFDFKSLLFIAILAFSSQAVAQDAAVTDTLLTPAQWVEFNQSIADAIQSDNEGVKVGALRMIIRYGLYLSMERDTAFNIMRIYRGHKDPAVRRMAVVSLGNMEDQWAIEFLDMLSPFEEDEMIKQTMDDVVREYREAHGGYPYE